MRAIIHSCLIFNISANFKPTTKIVLIKNSTHRNQRPLSGNSMYDFATLQDIPELNIINRNDHNANGIMSCLNLLYIIDKQSFAYTPPLFLWTICDKSAHSHKCWHMERVDQIPQVVRFAILSKSILNGVA